MFHATVAVRRGTLAAIFLATLFASSSLSQPVHAQAPQAGSETTPPGEGRLYNLTQRPFVVQFHRADGVKWSDGFVIQPGQFYARSRASPRRASGHHGPVWQWAGVRDRAVQRSEVGRLSHTAPDGDERQHHEARAQLVCGRRRQRGHQSFATRQRGRGQSAQENLAKQPALTPAELESMKRTLRANYVLTD